jgi:DNA recombination protein RmuC
LRAAQARVRSEMKKHIDDISSKYLIPGETQEPAIMFVPAESIFCTVSADFFDVVQYAQRKRVAVVSPNMLMLAVSTMRAVLRDQEMREQAHLIQEEVRKLLGDVKLLESRADKLKGHFEAAEKDLHDMGISTRKILARGEKIAAVEIEDARLERASPQPMLLAGE